MIAAVEEAFARSAVLREHKLRHDRALARLRELERSEREWLGMGMRGIADAPAAAGGLADGAPALSLMPVLPAPALSTRALPETALPPGGVLVFEPHPLLRTGMAAVLREIGVRRATLVGSLGEGVPLLRQLAPQLVIADLDLADSSGLATLRALRQAAPEAAIMVAAQRIPLELARECFSLGARGFLEKSIAPDQMAWAIEVMLRGGQFLPEALTEHLAARAGARADTAPAGPAPNAAVTASAPLPAGAAARDEQQTIDCSRITGRQRDVARLIAAGLTNKEIARELNISLGTAKNYVAQILSILGAKTRSRAATLMLSHKAAGAAGPGRGFTRVPAAGYAGAPLQ